MPKPKPINLPIILAFAAIVLLNISFAAFGHKFRTRYKLDDTGKVVAIKAIAP